MKFGAAEVLRAYYIKKYDISIPIDLRFDSRIDLEELITTQRPGYTVSARRQGAYSNAKKAAAEEYFAAMFQRYKEAKEAKGEGQAFNRIDSRIDLRANSSLD